MDFVNPSPLNYLPPLSILCTKKPKVDFVKFLSHSARSNQFILSQKPNQTALQDHYHKLMKKLIQRYFRERADIAINETATMESIEALQEDIAEFHSLLEKTDAEQYERQLKKTTPSTYPVGPTDKLNILLPLIIE